MGKNKARREEDIFVVVRRWCGIDSRRGEGDEEYARKTTWIGKDLS